LARSVIQTGFFILSSEMMHITHDQRREFCIFEYRIERLK